MNLVNQPQDLNLITLPSENVFVPEKKRSQQISPDNSQLCMETNIIAVQKFSPASNTCAFENSDDQLVVENLNDINVNPLNQVHDIASEIIEFVRTSTSFIEIPKPSQTFKNSLNLSQQSREFIEIRENPKSFLDYRDSYSPTDSKDSYQESRELLENREVLAICRNLRDSSSASSLIDSDQEEDINFLEPTELFFFEEAKNA